MGGSTWGHVCGTCAGKGGAPAAACVTLRCTIRLRFLAEDGPTHPKHRQKQRGLDTQSFPIVFMQVSLVLSNRTPKSVNLTRTFETCSPGTLPAREKKL